MNRKAIFFSIAIILIIAFSNLTGFLRLSKTALDPRKIDGTELAAVPPAEESIRFFQARIKENP